MHPDAPYFVSFLCLTPDDFTRQRESAATQWVNIVDERAKWSLTMVVHFFTCWMISQPRIVSEEEPWDLAV